MSCELISCLVTRFMFSCLGDLLVMLHWSDSGKHKKSYRVGFDLAKLRQRQT